jgi:hypothetical protein
MTQPEPHDLITFAFTLLIIFAFGYGFGYAVVAYLKESSLDLSLKEFQCVCLIGFCSSSIGTFFLLVLSDWISRLKYG